MKLSNDTATTCGLFCGTCPKFPEICQGCFTEEKKSCEFHMCANEHNATRCFECVNFPCERLKDFSTKHWVNGICHHTTIISDLQFMKDHSIEEWVDKNIKENLCPKCGKLIYWTDKNSHICK